MAKLIFYTQSYNNEDTIEQAIDSVLAQTMADFIYYIADDCSGDGTAEILRRKSREDNRIRLILRSENGYMNTHRYALQTMMEEHPEALYFAQLDGDDWYAPGFAETCVAAMDAGADLAVCSVQFVEEDESGTLVKCGIRQWFEEAHVLSRQEISGNFSQLHVHLRTIWAKMYRFEILREHKLQHPSMILAGDTIFAYNYLRYVHRLFITPELLHFYRYHATSQSYRYDPQRHESLRQMNEAQVEALKQLGADQPANLDFLSATCLCDFADALVVDVKHMLAGHEIAKTIPQLMQDPLVHKGLEALRYSEIFMGIGEAKQTRYIKQGTNNLRWAMARLCEAGRLGDAWAVLCGLYAHAGQFWDEDDLPHFIASDDSPATILLERGEAAALKPLRKSRPKDDAFLCGLWAYLDVQVRKRFEAAGEYLAAYAGRASEKQLAYFAGQHPLLAGVEGGAALLRDAEAARLLCGGDYAGLLALLPQRAAALAASRPEDALAFARTGQLVASLLEETGHYIFFCKAELELKLSLGQREAFQTQWQELHELLPDDEDLRQMYEVYLQGE